MYVYPRQQALMQTQSERQEMAPPDYETDRKDIYCV